LTGVDAVVTGTVIYYKEGERVTLSLQAAITGTSNTTAATLTGMPVVLAPGSNNQSALCRVTDNGTTVVGIARVTAATGVITLFPTAAGGSFTGSGTKGVQPCNFTYLLN
jgi:hypothetical protein